MRKELALDTRSRTHPLQPDDPAYERCVQRLKEDLGFDDEAIEVILNLRNQVTALQTRMRTLESTLEIYEIRHGARLTRYREVIEEASWEDL
jgi:hypothetical protein